MIRSTAGLAAVAMVLGTFACAGNSAGRDDDTAAAAAQDSSEVQTPPGYSGMERDTTQVPTDRQPTAVDTFLNEQGTGVPTDTMGYGGLEHPDTSAAARQDTGGAGWSDTTGSTGADTSGMSGMSDSTGMSGMGDSSGMSGMGAGMSGMGDSTGMSGMGDSTGQSSWDTTGQQ